MDCTLNEFREQLASVPLPELTTIAREDLGLDPDEDISKDRLLVEMHAAFTGIEKGDLPPMKEDKEDKVVVMCRQVNGRRRAGRHWAHGKTKLPLDKVTPEMLEALSKDPMFRVTLP